MKTEMFRRLRGAVTISVLVMAGGGAYAGSAATAGGSRSAGASYFGNVELVAHDGRHVRLYDDLIADRTVVFSSFFSRCQGVCPPLHAKLTQIRRELGDRMNRDVLIVSISVDPEFDTPERLKEYASRMRVGDGWLMLSGEPSNVRSALQKLGFATETKEAHSPLLIIGKERTGLWKKAHGFAPATELLEIINSVVSDGEE